jgi:type IV pilus assembly protein PilM
MDNPQKVQEIKDAPVSALKPKNPFQDIFSAIKTFFSFSQDIIGLDIGYSYIKIVQLRGSRSSYAVINYLTRAIPSTVKNNPPEMKKLVKEIIKEFIANSRIKSNAGRLVISGKGIYIFSITVPPLSRKDLRGAIGLELKKRLPFQVDLNNVSFEFFITNEMKTNNELSGLQVTCIAADSVMLDESASYLKGIGINPTVINVSADALGNLLSVGFKDIPEGQTVAILDLGANASCVHFYNRGLLRFSRDIPIGGEHIAKAMVRTITTPSGAINITIEEAEKIKRQCGILLGEDAITEHVTDFGILLGSQISAMLRPILERFINELVRTFNYYTNTFNTDKIELMYITGGTSRIKNMDRFLAIGLKDVVNKIEYLNPLKAVKGWTDSGVFRQELVMEQAAPHLGAAFGVCLGNGGMVNLLPLREKIERKAGLFLFLIKFSFPLILILSLSFYVFSYLDTLRYKILIAKSQADIQRLEPMVARIKDYLALKTRTDQRKTFLEKMVGRQPLWWGLLRELSNITPEGVILYKLTSSQKAPKEIRLIGKIFARYSTVDLALSQYLEALDESPYFSRVDLISTKTDMYSAVPRSDFEISCVLRY